MINFARQPNEHQLRSARRWSRTPLWKPRRRYISLVRVDGAESRCDVVW